MIEKIQASCLGLRQLKQQKFGWQGRGFHSQDLEFIKGMGSGVRRIRQRSETHAFEEWGRWSRPMKERLAMQIAGWLSEPCKTGSGRIVGVFEAELVRKTKRISHGKRRKG